MNAYPVLQLRLRMPFDGAAHERNLIMKLRRYRRVLVEPNSLTYLPDFLRAARHLIARRATGAWNIVNPGVLSPYELMELYREVVDPSHTFAPLSRAEITEVASVPRSNCRLNTDRLQREGIVLQPVREAAREALRALAGQLPRRPTTGSLGGNE